MNPKDENELKTDPRTPDTRQPESISVVLPAFNEASGIEQVVNGIARTLQSLSIPYEIIVVDDGSTDGTYAAVTSLCRENSYLRTLRFSRNFGKEAALLAGLRNAGGEVVITMDADLQHPPDLIPGMIDEWRRGAQVVHGVKRNRDTDGLVARSLSALFNTVFSVSGGIDLRDASDFKLLDRTVVKVIVDNLPERQRFYRGLAAWVGFRQRTIPFDVDARKAGEGKWSTIGLIELAATAIMSFTSGPLRIITILGVATLVFAIVLSAETLWSWFRGQSVSGFATIIITLLLIGSFIMISLGIIGEYIAKIYDEIKNRPSYLIESKCGFEKGNDDGSTRTI